MPIIHSLNDYTKNIPLELLVYMCAIVCVSVYYIYIYMQIRLSVFGVNAIFWSHCPVLESLEFSHFFLMFHECLYTISYGRLLVSHGCFTRTCFFSGCRSQT